LSFIIELMSHVSWQEILPKPHLKRDGTAVLAVRDKQVYSSVRRWNPDIQLLLLEVSLDFGAHQLLSGVNGKQGPHSTPPSSGSHVSLTDHREDKAPSGS
jgi:hypothetical protein